MPGPNAWRVAREASPAAGKYFHFMLNERGDLASCEPVQQQPVNHGPAGTPRLNPTEVEVVQLFAQFSYALGQRRSVGEIYGLLFVSHLPLSFQDLKERLQLSSGSTSQGVKYLRELGAVREVELPAERRTRYEAVAAWLDVIFAGPKNMWFNEKISDS